MMNSVQNVHRLSSLCRLCLRPGITMHPLFDGDDDSFLVKIFDIIRIELHKEDGFPGHMCQQCCFQLVSAVNFKQCCISSQHTLRTHILQARASLGIRPCVPCSPEPTSERNTATCSDEVPIKVDSFWEDCEEVDPLSTEAQERSNLQIVVKSEPPEAMYVDQNSPDDFLDSKRMPVEGFHSTENNQIKTEPVNYLLLHDDSDGDDCGSSMALVSNEEVTPIVERNFGERSADIAPSEVTIKDERTQLQDQLLDKIPVVKHHVQQQPTEDSPPARIAKCRTMSESSWTDDISDDSYNSSTGLDDGGSDWSVYSNKAAKQHFYKNIKTLSTSVIKTRKSCTNAASVGTKLNSDECIQPKSTAKNQNTNTLKDQVKPDKTKLKSSTKNRNTLRGKVNHDKCIQSKSATKNRNTDTLGDKVNPDKMKLKSSTKNRNRDTIRGKVNPDECIEPRRSTVKYLNPYSLGAKETDITNSMLEDSMQEKCTICLQSFSCKTSLVLHDKEFKNMLTCCACDKTFNFTCNLTQHKLSHLAHRNYQCKFCPKRFLFVSHVAIHGKVHITDNDIKGETCYVCNNSFSNLNSLSDHYRLKHTGEHAHTCHKCGEVCGSAPKLKNHYLSHRKPGPYTCTHCNRTFDTHRGLKVHLSKLKRPPLIDV